MSSRISPVGLSYFSLEAFCRDRQETSSVSLMQRALLSLQRQHRFNVSSLPQGQAFSVPEEWVLGIVSRLALRVSSTGSAEISLQRENIKALEHFLLELRDPGNSLDTLLAQFDGLDKSLRAILCKWVWHADKEPEGGLQYGRDRIRRDPRHLLFFADENGNNIIERLIELSAIDPLNTVIEQCGRETFHPVDPIALESCKKILYTAIAQKFARKLIKVIGCWKIFMSHRISPIASMDDLSLRYEIVKLCAKQHGKGTARYIQNFRIRDVNSLFEVAKLCARQSGERQAAIILKFGIRDPDCLFEIAKLCAQENGKGTAKSIQNFRITDSVCLFEIAKLCAQQSGSGTACYIHNFRIKNADRLFEIAKLCAEENGAGTTEHIQNFGITDPDHLFEIAKLCAQQSGSGTACYLHNFRIKNPDHLFEIAKLCAEENGAGTTEHIQNFGITDPDRLFEIAKLCSRQNGWTAEYIQNFGIRDPDCLFEIAKLCAQENGKGTSYYIQNFGITNQDHLFEIAKLCSRQSGWTTEYIQNFGIRDPDRLFEIAKRCALQNGKYIISGIDRNFSPLTADQKARLKNLCVWSMVSSLELSDLGKDYFIPFQKNKFTN